jgi:hypothetical protein
VQHEVLLPAVGSGRGKVAGGYFGLGPEAADGVLRLVGQDEGKRVFGTGPYRQRITGGLVVRIFHVVVGRAAVELQPHAVDGDPDPFVGNGFARFVAQGYLEFILHLAVGVQAAEDLPADL